MAWIYCNPLVVIEVSVIFMIFAKIDMGKVKWINQFSAACFTVFLTHGYFIIHIKIDFKKEYMLKYVKKLNKEEHIYAFKV